MFHVELYIFVVLCQMLYTSYQGNLYKKHMNTTVVSKTFQRDIEIRVT